MEWCSPIAIIAYREPYWSWIIYSLFLVQNHFDILQNKREEITKKMQTNKQIEIRLSLDWLDCGVCCLREFHNTVQLQRTTQGHHVLSQYYDPERFQSIHQQWSLQLRNSAVDISIDRRTETDLFKGHVPLHRQISLSNLSAAVPCFSTKYISEVVLLLISMLHHQISWKELTAPRYIP